MQPNYVEQTILGIGFSSQSLSWYTFQNLVTIISKSCPNIIHCFANGTWYVLGFESSRLFLKDTTYQEALLQIRDLTIRQQPLQPDCYGNFKTEIGFVGKSEPNQTINDQEAIAKKELLHLFKSYGMKYQLGKFLVRRVETF